MAALIEFRNVSRLYGEGEAEVRALDGVDLTIRRGEFVAIMGPSGSGKSTAMNIIGCLDRPTGGQYLFDGTPVENLSPDALALLRRHCLGFVFQGFNLLARTSALENVELPLIYRGIPAAKRQQLAIAALQKVGLEGRMDHRPNQMSGGQQQRVAVARALAASPPLILADEPTGNLDTKAGAQVFEIIRQLNAEGNTIVLITHDDELALKAQRMVRITDGKIDNGDAPEGKEIF